MCNMYVMHTRVQYASYYVSVYTLVGDALLLSKQSPGCVCNSSIAIAHLVDSE